MKHANTLASTLFVFLFAWLVLSAEPASAQTIPLKPCLEHFTASTCPPCAAWAPVFRRTLAPYEGQFTIIRYQMYWPGTGDPYYFPESKKRRDYYTITGVPGLACNGEKQVPYAQSFSAAKMDSLLALKTGLSMDLSASVNSDKIVTVTLKITPEIAYAAGLIARIVVMEGVTTQNASTNGEKAFDHVTMAFAPDATGTVLPALAPGQDQTLSFTVDMKTTFMETANDLLVAAFVQNEQTKKVIQSQNAIVTDPFTDYSVTLNVIDNDYNTVPGGMTFMPYNGEIIFGNTGLAVYKNVFPGTYDLEVNAPGYEGTTGEVTVTGDNVTMDVMLEKPDVFYYEDFGWNTLPEGWTADLINGFYLQGSGSAAGTMVLYKPAAGDDENYLILPEMNLTQTGIFSFRAGNAYGSPELRVGIATVASSPGTTGTAGLKITGFSELYSTTVSRAEGFSLVGFPIPELPAGKRFAFRYVGNEGSYCELDRVAILEDNPGVKVQFLVTDQNDVPLKNTAVSFNGKTVDNNPYGYATFRDTDFGSYVYQVTYKGQEIAAGTLNVDDNLLKEIKYNTSGIDPVSSVEPVYLFPNPVRDHFTVNGLQAGTVSVRTLTGKEMIHRKFDQGESISTEGLAKGIYLVTIRSGNQIIRSKMVITD